MKEEHTTLDANQERALSEQASIDLKSLSFEMTKLINIMPAGQEGVGRALEMIRRRIETVALSLTQTGRDQLDTMDSIQEELLRKIQAGELEWSWAQRGWITPQERRAS